MTDGRVVHLVLPAGYDDPGRTSGGNVYDRRLVTGLAALGWTVRVHDVEGGWPEPGSGVADAVERQLAGIPDGAAVILDGLLGTVAAAPLARQADRLRLVLLVHMPGAPGGPPGAVLQRARLVVATSDWTARTLIEMHGLAADTVVVAPPGAPSAGRSSGTESGSSLLCVAAVTSPKGQDVLVAALATLVDRPWTCAFVGALDREPAFVELLRKTLGDSGIDDRIRLTGPLGEAELEREYAAADLLVLPTRLEGYGLVVTEALAHGLPVIASSVGGVPEALGEAVDGSRPGILVPPGDAPALGAAIARWLGQPELRAELRWAAESRRAMLEGWGRTAATVATAVSRLDGR